MFKQTKNFPLSLECGMARFNQCFKGDLHFNENLVKTVLLIKWTDAGFTDGLPVNKNRESPVVPKSHAKAHSGSS